VEIKVEVIEIKEIKIISKENCISILQHPNRSKSIILVNLTFPETASPASILLPNPQIAKRALTHPITNPIPGPTPHQK